MAICKFCAKPFAWGSSDGKWVPLVPVEDHDGLDRVFQDENGVLRAEHRAVCAMRGGPTVRVSRLVVAIKAKDIIGVEHVKKKELDILEILERKRLRKALKKQHQTVDISL